MKKMITVLLLCVFILSAIPAPGYCNGPVRKLGRGIWNIITCPVELFHRIKTRSEDAGPFEGITSGLLEGIVMMIFRAGVGAYETIFFIAPIPENYQPMITDPEFFFLNPPADDKASHN